MQLLIRQQPKYGRRIGFSGTNTFIYPELVLELRNVEKGIYLCHVHVTSIDQTDSSILIRKEKQYENVTGTKIQTSAWKRDPVDGKEKCFFMFADLGIRAMGEYRLVCNVINPDNLTATTTTTTDVILISTPKECPGVGAPSTLVKSLSIQGMSKAGRRYKDLLL
jgi:hypothetical protein